jgi:hypothetical protein
MKASIQKAIDHLPPELVQKAWLLGIEPVRIENSGAMRFRISNRLALEKKSAALELFKGVLRDYGLDLSRITTDTTSDSVWDASILMIKRNEFGQTMPLFNKDGSPCMNERPIEPAPVDRKKAIGSPSVLSPRPSGG